jgi:MYXO-CTERM domain-containing protein
MRTKFTAQALFAAVVLGLFAGSADAQNLLTNPSFEAPLQLTTGNHINVAPTGWGIDRGQFNLVREATAFDGQQFLDLTGPAGGAGTYVFQNFTLATPSAVTFSGYFSGRDGGIGGGNVAIFSGGSEIAAAPRVTTTGTNTPWAQSISTTGGLAAGTYQFRAFIDDPANVDLVSVTAVPEPVALSLLGLGALGLLRRRA